MRLAHFVDAQSAEPRLAAVHEERAIFVDELVGGQPLLLQEFIEAGDDAKRALAEAMQSADWASAGRPVASLKFASAVLHPPVVLAVGLNYDEHASELNLESDSGPVLFALFPNSLCGHDANVLIPTKISQEVDYEGELGVILGRDARNVPLDQALNYVFGYTAVNDITARDVQFREPQWSRSKSFDTFTPNGPYVVTADEIDDPQQLTITTDVDGLRVQDATTAQMIRSVAQIIHTVSQGLTIRAGTMIATGSPGGSGRSRKPPLFLTPGTEVTVTIEKIGALTSHCVRAD